MRMKGLLTIVLMLLSLSTYGQISMRDCFLKMPTDLFPYLTENNRLDCIDFIDSRMKAEVKDAFGTKITLDTLTANYLHLTIGERVCVEMRLFPISEDSVTQLLCVSKTFGDSVQQSSLRSYDPNTWQPIAYDKYIYLPKFADGDFVAISLPKEGNEIKLTRSFLVGDDRYTYEKELMFVNFEY